MKKNFSTYFALFCFLCLVLCLGTETVFSHSPATVYSKVLRLHVLANSDSKEDQQLKLKVRDELLVVTQELFSDCKNVKEALKIAGENKDLLENAANRVLLENKSEYKAKIVVGKEYYPEKSYGSFTFPRGEYLSVRVLIGSGKGQNWWCVLFPPLCGVGIEDEGKVMVSHGISQSEVERLEKENEHGSVEVFGCRVKLKILELFG